MPSQQPQQQLRQQMPPLANSPGLSVVQLPTQPLPASEIVKQTSKQVLLEPKSVVQAAPSPASPNPAKIPVPTTSPRTTSVINLPTQPVPLSAAQLNSVANAIVARSMTSVNPMPMLPNQPLPQIAAMHLQQQVQAAQAQAAQAQAQAQQPKLPQHPLPPSTSVSLSVITSVASPTPTSTVIKQQHMAPKKRVIAQAEEEAALAAQIKAEQDAPVITIKKETSHMKPRDAFGRGAHLVKEEKTSMSKLLQPPPPSSPSLAVQEQQLALMRDQEINLFYNALLKQGQMPNVALSLAQDMAEDRYKKALAVACLSSSNDSRQQQTPNIFVESFQRPAPLPAHTNDRTASPHLQRYIHPDDQRHILQLNPPASPEPEFANLPNLDAYPMVWKGFLGLKNDFASVEFRYVSGCKELAQASLPHDLSHSATLRIGQRMRLEAAHLSGVRTKMQQAAEHCVLLALPCGTDAHDVAVQSRQLRSHFITYLQLKGAAGIVNVPGEEGGFVVHVFPSCDFANETMTSIAPDLLAKVAEMEHMVIVIATVLDKTS
jgi:hypothetical protein